MTPPNVDVAPTMDCRRKTLTNRVYHFDAQTIYITNSRRCPKRFMHSTVTREGDLFGDDHFGVGDSHTQDASNRTATVSIRMAPCELLVLPARYQCKVKNIV